MKEINLKNSSIKLNVDCKLDHLAEILMQQLSEDELFSLIEEIESVTASYDLTERLSNFFNEAHDIDMTLAEEDEEGFERIQNNDGWDPIR